jgi:hypothetical protein
MIYIYFPNALFLFIWLYYFQYSIWFSILLTPISYLLLNGYLIYTLHYNLVNKILDDLVVFQYLENTIYYIISWVVYLIFQLPYVNKLYGILKVKLLIYIFNFIMSFIPTQKTNPLTEELQNDYLEILNKNRNKREIKVNDLN